MKIISSIVLIIVLLAGALWWVSDRQPAEPVKIDNARIRLVPGGAPMAGYFVVTNRSQSPIRLAGARTDAFDHVMIHRSVVSDGSSHMEHQDEGVRVMPDETVAFEPGGLHLMLMDARRALAIGDEVSIVLTFEGAEPPERPMVFTVVPVTTQ